MSLVFIGLLATPTLFSLFNTTSEHIAAIDVNEEENKNEELEKDIELELRVHQHEAFFQDFLTIGKYNNAKNEHYFLELSKVNTPPPEVRG